MTRASFDAAVCAYYRGDPLPTGYVALLRLIVGASAWLAWDRLRLTAALIAIRACFLALRVYRWWRTGEWVRR